MYLLLFYNHVNYVVDLFNTGFTPNITVNIEIGYGDFPYNNSLVTGVLGESQPNNNQIFINYGGVKQALINESAPGANTLPPIFPPIPIPQLVMDSEQVKVLGWIGAGSSLDGWIGIASNVSWSLSPTPVPAANHYCLVGVLEHEIAEVIGRESYLMNGEYEVMDLYRYSAPGIRQTGIGGPSYFSTHNGTTDLDDWNNTQLAPGDRGDWTSTAYRRFSQCRAAGPDRWAHRRRHPPDGRSRWGNNQVAPPEFNADGKADILWPSDNGDVDLWDSNAGPGVGFTSQDLGLAGNKWHIVPTFKLAGPRAAVCIPSNALSHRGFTSN